MSDERAFPVEPDPSTVSVLPGATFSDSFAIAVPGHLQSEEAARHAINRIPRWAATLMDMRDRLVSVVGLKRLDQQARDNPHAIGGFPVLSATPERTVLGLDDKHLDFRLVIDALANDSGTEIRATTLVWPRNFAGRAYLAAIMPFHKAIVPATLNRLAGRVQPSPASGR